MGKRYLTIFIIIGCCLTFAFKCNKSDSDAGGIFKGRLYTDNQLKTPQGASVFAQRAINTELLPLVDAGIERLNQIASAAPNNYSNLAPPSAYKVYLFPRSPRCENPAFLIETDGGSYDGSEWDKNTERGKVALCAAGMTVADDYSILVVDDAATMPTIVRYEGEHLALFHVDRERYEATKFHTAMSFHPILGDGVQRNVRSWSDTEPKPQTVKAITIDLKDGKINKGRPFCVLLSK